MQPERQAARGEFHDPLFEVLVVLAERGPAVDHEEHIAEGSSIVPSARSAR